MLRNKLWIGIILSILLLVFTVPGFASYYRYTQESGALFYVSTADEADALENHNEVRQILDDLGNLLVHSKRNDLYPKDKSTGGTLSIPNSALASFIAGTKGDLFYCSADNVWIKLSVGTDNQVLVVATDVPNWETFTSDLLSDVASIAMLDEVETITGNWLNTAHPWADNEVADDITCSNYYLKTEIDTQGEMETIWDVALVNDSDLDLYYLKTAIDTQSKMETIWETTLATDAELTTALADYYLKVDINTQAKMESIWNVSLVNDGDLDLYYLKTAIDSQGEMETIWGVNLATDTELTTALADYYLKLDINTQGEMETIWGVDLANDADLHTIMTIGTGRGLTLAGQAISLTYNTDTTDGSVLSGAGQDSKVWKTDAAGVPGWRTDLGGEAFTFLDATDTPVTYTGQGGKFVRVAGTEDSVEFYVMAGGGDVFGPATSVDNTIVRWNGTDNKTIQDSLVTIDDNGSINIPTGQSYKINGTALAVGNITGAAASGANSDITSLTGLTTPLAITKGGTGSVSAEGARTALGLTVGTNVQAYDTGLSSLAGLTYASDSFIKVTATDVYAIRTIAETKADLAFSSDDLSDVASIAMLDEEETVTNWWTFKDHIIVSRTTDTAMGVAYLDLIRDRDGDPTRNVSSGDYLGEVTFGGYHTSSYSEAARIFGIVDGTPGEDDMPGRLEFCTTPDGGFLPLRRMAIDNAGNIKMGDGAWTNYVQITNAGVLTLEGTANIGGVDATEFGYLDGVTSDIQTQLDAKKGKNYYSALGDDHTYSDSADVDTQPVGESVAFGDLLYFDWTDKEWKKAKADSSTTVPGLRIALETKADGETCLILVKGYIRDDSAFEFAGAMVYVSEATAGAMTSTAPSTAGNQLQRVGQAKSADILFFDPSIDVGEI